MTSPPVSIHSHAVRGGDAAEADNFFSSEIICFQGAGQGRSGVAVKERVHGIVSIHIYDGGRFADQREAGVGGLPHIQVQGINLRRASRQGKRSR